MTTTRFTAADYRALQYAYLIDSPEHQAFKHAAEQAEQIANAMVRVQELELMVSYMLQERKEQAEQIAQIRAAAEALLRELDFNGYASLSEHRGRQNLRAILDAAGEK